MVLDAVLAYFHFVAIFMLFAYLVAESMIIKRPLDAVAIRRIGKIDLIYGGMAVAVLITGFLRLVYGAKGADFYLQSWPVYVKVVSSFSWESSRSRRRSPSCAGAAISTTIPRGRFRPASSCACAAWSRLRWPSPE